MLESTPRKSTWIIHILTVVLLFLISWLFSFVVDDLNEIGRPNETAILEANVDMDLYSERNNLKSGLKEINSSIKSTRESLENIKSASDGANGDDVSIFSKRLIDQETRKSALMAQLRASEDTYNAQYSSYRKQWQISWDKHRFWVAVYKLSFIIPMFVLASWLRSNRRASAIKPVYTALLVASFWHLGIIAHDHFPDEVFKYIAISVGIAIVLAALVHLLRRASAPRDLDLLKLRREAYANKICSCCAFPISNANGAVYTCPSCGTTLFEKCNGCDSVRHSLLPFCGACGIE
ncbi:MAG: hypothetical protein QGF46_04670 [Planctomycetota bacterium]|jgi:predicted RNA-binding Zn-ribbon protein involved in translation (DUF1610 family)|nr:hypothetical protein [Planctomycetota bacterium]